MNERIQQLAVEARNYALDEKRIYERVHNTEQCMEEYRDVYNKKFAELIVAECLAECWYDATPKQIADNIRGRLGVEE
jgi:hypothetical protein